jgi:hypothetical protein
VQPDNGATAAEGAYGCGILHRLSKEEGCRVVVLLGTVKREHICLTVCPPKKIRLEGREAGDQPMQGQTAVLVKHQSEWVLVKDNDEPERVWQNFELIVIRFSC